MTTKAFTQEQIFGQMRKEEVALTQVRCSRICQSPIGLALDTGPTEERVFVDATESCYLIIRSACQIV